MKIVSISTKAIATYDQLIGKGEVSAPKTQEREERNEADARLLYWFNAYLWNKNYVTNGKVPCVKLLIYIDEYLNYLNTKQP